MDERLGHTYRDKITGFEGVAVGHVSYLTGCNQTLLSPATTDNGKINDSHWFDDQRLAQVQHVKQVVLDNGATPGFGPVAPGGRRA